MNALPGLIGLATAGLLAFSTTSCRRTKGEAGPPPAAAVTVAVPLVEKILEWDEYVGRLAAPESVEIRARVSGYLEKRHFKEGTSVAKGDLLFTIDPRPYAAAVDGALAERDRSRTHADQAANDAKRAETLIKSSAIAIEGYESRIKAAAEAEAAVRVAEAALKTAQLNLEFTSIRAPISGRISYAPVTEGNLVTGGERDATLLTTIVSLDPIYCYIEVDEQASLKYRDLFRQGKRPSALFETVPAEMGLASEKGFPRRGELNFVDNVLRAETGTIRARAVFPNEDKLMAPGFFARVRIPGSGEYEALLVRDEAIGSDQGRPFVFVVGEDDKAIYRTVETGPVHDRLRVIRSGLKAGEKVVINGLMNVRDGSAVRPEVASMALPAPAIAQGDAAGSRP